MFYWNKTSNCYILYNKYNNNLVKKYKISKTYELNTYHWYRQVAELMMVIKLCTTPS